MQLGELKLDFAKPGRKSISGALKELQGFDLSLNADAFVAYLEKFVNRGNHQEIHEMVTCMDITAKAVKAILPVGGRAVSYEKNLYWAVHSYDGSIGPNETVRTVEWTNKPLDVSVKICALLFELGVQAHVVEKTFTVRFYCPGECYISNLYKTDDPTKWPALNQSRVEKLKKRRMIKQVINKLDRE